MNKLKQYLDPKTFKNTLAQIVTNEERRWRMQYDCLLVMLAIVSGFMTILNIVTRKGSVTFATAIFTLACLLNLLLMRRMGNRGSRIVSGLFMAEILSLFTYFIISGSLDGFSVIWVCMLPACGMLLLSIKTTTALCAVMLAILIFFYWTPLGKNLLLYDYSPTFLMRFPLLFVVFFMVSLLLESIRAATQRELDKMRSRHDYLYAHDALTNLLNRHGLSEWSAKVQVTGEQAVLMMDIDHFKHVNDSYGHDVGDLVLARIADISAQYFDTKICRWGGEEFVAWFPGGNFKDADAERLRAAVEDMEVQVPNCDKTVRVTISIGVAKGGPGDALEDLIKLADQRLYQAKAAGRNRVVYE